MRCCQLRAWRRCYINGIEAIETVEVEPAEIFGTTAAEVDFVNDVADLVGDFDIVLTINNREDDRECQRNYRR